MTKRLLEFRKTNHFLLSQWSRNIEDQILYKVLPFVECTKHEKDIILVLPSFLQRNGFAKDDKTCLIMVVYGNLILTGYWCDKPNYLFNKEKSAHFQILY